jgi:hypothetical protein
LFSVYLSPCYPLLYPQLGQRVEILNPSVEVNWETWKSWANILHYKRLTEVIRLSRKGNTFSFRLRKIDADLEAAISSIDASALSDLCRDGLRMALGLTKTKRVEVVERPLMSPAEGMIPAKGAALIYTKKVSK